MKVHRLPLSPLVEGEVVLSPAAGRYLSRVLRLHAGAGVEVFDPVAGVHALASVAGVRDDEVTLHVGAMHRLEPEGPPVVLVQGLPKGDKLADIVRDATELGVTLVAPAVCARSVARPDAEKLSARALRLAAVAAEAARQCGRSRAPTVMAPMPWDDALEAARLLAARRIVLWERATVPLRQDLLDLSPSSGVAFAVGPEGGLTGEEVATAEELGFAPRSLGQVILRTETVAAAVLGALRVLRADEPSRERR